MESGINGTANFAAKPAETGQQRKTILQDSYQQIHSSFET